MVHQHTTAITFINRSTWNRAIYTKSLSVIMIRTVYSHGTSMCCAAIWSSPFSVQRNNCQAFQVSWTQSNSNKICLRAKWRGQINKTKNSQSYTNDTLFERNRLNIDVFHWNFVYRSIDITIGLRWIWIGQKLLSCWANAWLPSKGERSGNCQYFDFPILT